LNALETVSLPKEYRALVWHVKLTSITILNSEVCGKPKFSLDSDVKNPNRIRTIQKIDIHAEVCGKHKIQFGFGCKKSKPNPNHPKN